MSTTNQAPTPSKPTLLGPGCTYLRPELHDLKVIGVEEHIVFPKLLAKIPETSAAKHVTNILKSIYSYPPFDYVKGRVDDAGAQRIKDMDEGGIAVQILSLSGAVNTTFMEPQEGLDLAREINNELKKATDRSPRRICPLAELPFQASDLAIQELYRCVKEMGFVGAMLCGSIAGSGKFLDDTQFDSILSAFEELDVPLFLHPGIPPKGVVDAYYSFPDNPTLTANLSCYGWGWHNEAAVHVLRLAVSGTLDRHPKLKVVIGHSGEMMPAMLSRFDQMFDQDTLGLERTVGQMLREQVWLSISGLFSIPATLSAVQTWGVDRVMFGCDYPFIDSQSVPAFLRSLGDVVAPSDMRKICQTNAEKLFKIVA
ncbi:hypothetical protein MMC10_009445 [Thelotrema lepadinum]|nr:hypothetical protein [Thelotrema lepadinum]